MISKYKGTCHGCSEPYAPGEQISKWLGQWMHATCRATKQQSMVTSTTEVPSVRPKVARQTVRPRTDFGKKRAHVIW